MNSPGNEERRPGGGGAENLNFTSHSTAPGDGPHPVTLDELIHSVRGRIVTPMFGNLTDREMDIFLSGFVSGRNEGWDAGWRAADDHAAAAHRALQKHLAPILRAPELDPAETAARRARIDARFTTKGGH